MTRFGGDEGGQAVVLLGLALTGMLVVGGLGIDAGLQYVERRHEQVAADSAAFAAAVSMVDNWSAANRATLATAAALDYAKRNGYDDDGLTNTVTVNIPPTSGAYAGNAGYAEIVVSVNVKTAFIRILGSSYATQSVRARAVGGIVAPPKDYALIALAKTGSPTMSLTGNAQVEVENAGILVNSIGTPALTTTSNASIEGSVDVAGTAQALGSVSGTLTTGASQQPDPLSYLAAPTSCGTTYTAVNATGGTTTLQPGCYPGISASGTATVLLASGTYVITGGGISVSGNATIKDSTPGDGVGVFIYNGCSFFPSSGGTCGAIGQSGNGNIDLEKAGTGQYNGVSIWQPCANTNALTVTGSPKSGIETTGSVYLPCAAVNVSGNGDLETGSGQLIASTVSAVGKGEIEVEWDATSSTPDRMPAIVE